MKTIYYLSLFLLLFQISFMDYKTYMIPIKYNIFLGMLGIVRLVYLGENPMEYVAAFGFMFCALGGMYLSSKGNLIGGGDVKLMSAAGLLLGLQKAVYALLIGCIFGLLFEGIRNFGGVKSKVFPMGPYLCFGILCQIIA